MRYGDIELRQTGRITTGLDSDPVEVLIFQLGQEEFYLFEMDLAILKRDFEADYNMDESTSCMSLSIKYSKFPEVINKYIFCAMACAEPQ